MMYGGSAFWFFTSQPKSDCRTSLCHCYPLYHKSQFLSSISQKPVHIAGNKTPCLCTLQTTHNVVFSRFSKSVMFAPTCRLSHQSASHRSCYHQISCKAHLVQLLYSFSRLRLFPRHKLAVFLVSSSLLVNPVETQTKKKKPKPLTG